MNFDDEFEPKLGRIRHGGSKTGRRYIQRVLQAATLAGGGRRKGFQGNRIGRGAGAGRVLASRDRYAAFRSRRVVVKSRVIRLKGTGLKAAAQHLRYIRRDGVTRDGAAGQLYDASADRADAKEFLSRSDGDRHQFRIIVSAEDGAEYDDLKPLTRRLMQQMEQDLGTKLDWVAVDHFNTGHPHTHIVLRGKDELGKDLVIARDYMAEGMRERAAEIVSLDLGPKSDREIEDKLRQEVDQERFTSLDRDLLRQAGEDGMVALGSGPQDAFRQSLRAGRLRKLGWLELAAEIQPGQWQLADGLETTLRAMGERGDIIKTLHRELAAANVARATADYSVFDPTKDGGEALVGRVVARGLSDELNDKHYLIVDGVDGGAHYVDVGVGSGEAAVGSIVEIKARPAVARDVDRTVARIAAQNAGRYSEELHRLADPKASPEFIRAHVRRLEAMRRLAGTVTRGTDGTWQIAPDHEARAARFEKTQIGKEPIVIVELARQPLAQQVMADAPTWLDRTLVDRGLNAHRDAGFGREANVALRGRMQWLVEQGLVDSAAGAVLGSETLQALARRELTRAARSIEKETGLRYVEPGAKVEGIYRRSVDLSSGKFAVIAKSREFTLVPWRSTLDRYVGKTISGLRRGDIVTWSFVRQRMPPMGT
jgi:type IV secretory pathway VirD2 relaxase